MIPNSSFDINCYRKYVQILGNMDSSKSKNTDSLHLIDFEHNTINKPIVRTENQKIDEQVYSNNDICYIKNVVEKDDGVIIPKLFHNMWLDKKDSSSNKYPEKYREYIINKEKLHPDFEHKVWSYDDTIKLMKEDKFLSDYISVFESLDLWICKCDFARLAVIYAKGGVYTDLNFYFKKNITNLLRNRQEYFVYEPKQHCDEYGISMITNGFFACIPKHKFIKDIIMYISKNRNLKIKNATDVLIKTGPIALANVYETGDYGFYIEKNCAIMPIEKSGKYSDICIIGQEYAIKKWVEGTKWWNDINYVYNDVNSMFIIIIIIIITILCIILYQIKNTLFKLNYRV